MFSDREVWATALLMVRRYRSDAVNEAANRAQVLLTEENNDGVVDWVRIIRAIEKLQATKPAEGEKLQ